MAQGVSDPIVPRLLKDIVNVSVEIAAPVVDSTSFDNILIIGEPPAGLGPEDPMPPEVGVYSSLDEVTSAGWVATGEDAEPVGIAARVAFSQSPQPGKIYISYDYDAVTAISNALSMSGWYVVCPAYADNSAYEDIASYVETLPKLFCYPVMRGAVPDLEIVNPVYFRSFGIFGNKTLYELPENASEANNYIHVAFAVKCLNYPAGSETWAFKTLSAVEPSDLTSTDVKTLSDTPLSYYTTYSSRNITMGGKVLGGEWIDVIRFRDWLQNDMQVRIFNLLATNPKIPYTDNGISLIENQMIASLKAGVKAGGISPDEYDEDGNVIPGFTVSVPLAANITASQKASRILSDCKFTARFAGAIHAININGVLVY
jgi:hypothetical protein